jgi:hypothetical protein
MRGKPEDAARRRLSDEEEAWIARQLEKAPPLGSGPRRRIEHLLAFAPDHVRGKRVEPRAS